MEYPPTPLVVTVATANEGVTYRVMRVLLATGASTIRAATPEDAAQSIFHTGTDAMFVDLTIGDGRGLDLIEFVRAASDIPILAVAPEVTPDLTIDALAAGADDLVSTDIDSEELTARLRARLRGARRVTRRAGWSAPDVIRTGDLVIDRRAHTVTKGGKPVALTPTEFRLLDALASRVGHVATWRYLVTATWGPETDRRRHRVRLHIGHLRTKLDRSASAPEYILTEWGIGYMLAHKPLVGGVVSGRIGAPAAPDIRP